MPKNASTEVAERKTALAGWYHFGLLPALGDVEWPVPKKNHEFGEEEFSLHKFTARKLWINAGGMEKGLSIFAPKARGFQGISVRGCHFPSFQFSVDQSAQEISKKAYPGNVSKFTSEQAEAVIGSCYKHILRFPNGIETLNSFGQPSLLIDLEHGAKPFEMSDEEWVAYKRTHFVPPPEKFDAATDRYVAEFVYFYPLAVETEPAMKDYKANPNHFHEEWAPSMSDIFTKPPKSVAEMFPQPGA